MLIFRLIEIFEANKILEKKQLTIEVLFSILLLFSH